MIATRRNPAPTPQTPIHPQRPQAWEPASEPSDPPQKKVTM